MSQRVTRLVILDTSPASENGAELVRVGEIVKKAAAEQIPFVVRASGNIDLFLLLAESSLFSIQKMQTFTPLTRHFGRERSKICLTAAARQVATRSSSAQEELIGALVAPGLVLVWHCFTKKVCSRKATLSFTHL